MFSEIELFYSGYFSFGHSVFIFIRATTKCKKSTKLQHSIDYEETEIFLSVYILPDLHTLFNRSLCIYRIIHHAKILRLCI
jgi:hypothetical protein